MYGNLKKVKHIILKKIRHYHIKDFIHVEEIQKNYLFRVSLVRIVYRESFKGI